MNLENHPYVFSRPPKALFFAVKEPVKIFGEGVQRKFKRV
jgi:hypothetical protein